MNEKTEPIIRWHFGEGKATLMDGLSLRMTHTVFCTKGNYLVEEGTLPGQRIKTEEQKNEKGY